MDFQQFLYSALNAILLAVIPILVAFIAQKLHVQTKNEKLNQYLDLVEDAVQAAVDYVGQTIVFEIKKDGAFDKAEQAKAFDAAKAMAMQIIGETGKKIVEQAGIDLGAFVTAKIEQQVSCKSE